MALTKVGRGLLNTSIVDNGNATALTIDSSENVGIGLSNPDAYYSAKLVVAAPDEDGITIQSSAGTKGYLMFADGTVGDAAYRGYLGYDHGTNLMNLVSFGSMNFYTGDTGANTERMRIDGATGNVTIGSSDATSKRLIFQGSGSVGYEGGINWQRDNAIDNSITVDSSESLSINFAQSDLASRALLFKSGSAFTERARLDSSGTLGLGVVPYTQWNAAYKTLQVGVSGALWSSTSSPNTLLSNNTAFNANGSRYRLATGGAAELYLDSNGNFDFRTSPTSGAVSSIISDMTSKMKLSASGTLNVGVAGPTNASSKIAIGLPTGAIGIETRPSNGDGYYGAVFYAQSGVSSGYIYVSASSTSFSQTSDYRLKEDVVLMTGATERVKALRPINFAWKVDGSRTDGFFAHEAQEVVPEAVIGSKDAMRDEEYEVTPAVEEIVDEDGNVTTEAVAAVMGTRSVPDYQGIDQSKLVPLLTATIQELIARIEALEGA